MSLGIPMVCFVKHYVDSAVVFSWLCITFSYLCCVYELFIFCSSISANISTSGNAVESMGKAHQTMLCKRIR